MDPVQDNTTPSGKDRSGWIIGIVVGALMALVATASIWIYTDYLKTLCSGPSAEASPGRLLSFYCSSVSPRPDLTLWAIILGLVIGVLTAVVIGIRARR